MQDTRTHLKEQHNDAKRAKQTRERTRPNKKEVYKTRNDKTTWQRIAQLGKILKQNKKQQHKA